MIVAGGELHVEGASIENHSVTLTQAWSGSEMLSQAQLSSEIIASFGADAAQAIGDYAARNTAPIDKAQAFIAAAEHVESGQASAAEKAWYEATQASGYSTQDALAVLNDPQARADYENWREGGASRIAAHTLVGALSGGVSGAAGAAASAAGLPLLAQEMERLDLSAGARTTALVAAGTAAGALTGGQAGAATAYNAVNNNFLKHDQAAAMKADFARCQSQARGCSDEEAKTLIAKYLQLSNANIEQVQGCIKAGDTACVSTLFDQAANQSEVTGVLPLGFGSAETVFVGRQANVKVYESVKGSASLVGSDLQDAATFAAFRASNCSGMTITACDALVQQAMDARTKRAGSLMALGAVVEAGASRLGSIKFTKPQGSYTNALPVQRIVFNGIELEPGLPPPVAGYDYSPTTVPRATTDNVLWSHWTGFQAEINLANTVASTGQLVVRWGAPVGQHGSDVVSVKPVTGEVKLWDSKYRSAPVKIDESPTFSRQATRDFAIQEAREAILEANIDAVTKSRALENINAGNFTTNTAGAGNARNSTQTRYCGFKPC